MKKKYTEEFKRQAVELSISLGSAIAAARQLGISDVNIYSWRSKFKQQCESKKSSSNLPPEEAEELKRLRRENSELKKVNHILKSAAAFFSQDHLK